MLFRSIPDGTKKEKRELRSETPIDLVWQRACGKCENCGLSGSDNPMIVGHRYHDGPNYNDLENLSLHCLACETRYHLIHIDHPEIDIGLEKKDNLCTTLSLLVRFCRYSPSEFRKFYHNHQEKIHEVFSYFKINYTFFVKEMVSKNVQYLLA